MTRVMLRFFRWFCHPSLRNSIEGDLVELYNERVIRHGARVASLLLTIDVIYLFRPSIIRPVKYYNGTFMFRNYFTIGWRNLLRNKGYSAINIGGLAAGMAVTILIGMWIYDELSYNKSFENYDRIGRVMVHNRDRTYPSNPAPLEWELRRNFSQDIKYVALCSWSWELAITAGEEKFIEHGIFAKPEATEIFSLDMVYGVRNALKEPGTIMISESLSKKLFADSDPVGQSVRLKNTIDAHVGGVYKDFLPNSDLYELDVVGSWDFILEWIAWMKESQDRWDNDSFSIFVQLQEGVSFEDISMRIKDLKKPHLDAERLKDNPELFIQPMRKWHLYSEFKDRKVVTSDQLQFVWLYGAIGVFVLMLACINFVNLSTARSEKRAKEVGVRKAMGSLRQHLITQFLSESFITVAIANVFSIAIVLLSLPYFNNVSAKHITFPWDKPMFWISMFCFMLIAGLMAGGYPAFYLSSFKPIRILKERMNTLPRQVLVVMQFTVSLMLIVGTIVVYRQIEYARDRPVGYSPGGLIKISMLTPSMYEHYEAMRNELILSGFAENVANGNGPTTDIWSNTDGITWEGKPEGIESSAAVDWVTTSYGQTVGWEFIQGRDFSDEIASDSTAVVITQTAAREMNMKNPIDQEIRWDDNRYHIIGVIEDMLMGSPYQRVMPGVFFLSTGGLPTTHIRLNSSMGTQEALAGVETIYRKHNPSVPFQFSFVEDDYNQKFSSEVRVGKLATVFSALAILISLLGLFGMSAFVAERRTKEIGIRKVIGASITDLWAMLTKNFVALVGISCAIAFPISWYLLSRWLMRFDYRIDISIWIFVIVIVGALMVTLATVSYQALRAALANPIESLKTE